MNTTLRKRERETVLFNKAAYIFCVVYYFLFLFLKYFLFQKRVRNPAKSRSTATAAAQCVCVCVCTIGELGAKSLSSFYIFLKSWDFFLLLFLVFFFRELEECNVAAFF